MGALREQYGTYDLIWPYQPYAAIWPYEPCDLSQWEAYGLIWPYDVIEPCGDLMVWPYNKI